MTLLGLCLFAPVFLVLGSYRFTDDWFYYACLLVAAGALTLQRECRELPPPGTLLALCLASWLLAGFIPCVFMRGHGSSPLTACKSNLKNLATACEMYASDYGGHYPADLTLLTGGNYLRTVPTCPAAGRDTYSSTYEVSAQPDSFRFACSGCHHHRSGIHAPNYPRYSAEEGLVWQP